MDGAAASEVVISRLIGNSLEIMSEKDALPYKLRTQLDTAHRTLENILSVCSVLRDSLVGADKALIRASEVEHTMEMLLLKALSRPKSRRGRLSALLRGVTHLVKLLIRARLSQAKAQIYVAKVEELSQHFPNIQGVECGGLSKGISSGGYQNLPSILSDKSAIVGREDTADHLTTLLTNSELLHVISVIGDEGIGKTALVRSLYNRPDMECHFECRAWIGDYNWPNLDSLLVEVLKQSPVTTLKDLELKETDRLCEFLHETLMELRYLIVLDNLTSVDILDNLMYALPDSRNGSRVIVTCRDVIHVLLPQEPWCFCFPVPQLDDKNSRKLLLQQRSINDNGLAETILNKCNGSPLKILLFGGLAVALKSNDPESSPVAWLRDLKEDFGVQDVMSLCYGSLPSWVKPCFLYLCLFPKECEISTRRLFQLWHAEGLVRGDGHLMAETCFRELVNRNLVQVVRRKLADGGPKTCRVSGHLHDYFSEMVTRFEHIDDSHDDSQKDNQQVFWPSRPTMVLPWLARYSSNHTSLPPGNGIASRIRSYVSFNTEKSGIRSREVEQLLKPLTGFRDGMLLRVLDLEGVYKPKLPKQFGEILQNLRYLGLRWTILDSLPESISRLSRLETLDLKHTNVTELPSSILRLKYLRHLYLNEVSFDKCKPNECSLGSLQTLWGLSIGAKSSFLTVLEKLKELKKLGLTCYAPVIPEVTKCILNMTKLESLRLRSRDLFGQPSKLSLCEGMRKMESISKLYMLGVLDKESLSYLPENLRVLTLSMSEMKCDPMKYLGSLQHLAILRLFANSYTGRGIVFRKGTLGGLRVLKLWKLEKLKTVSIHEGTMPSLEELDMRDCTKVKEITGLEHVTKLKKIKLTRVNKDFVEQVKSNPPKAGTIVICRDLVVSSPEDKKEADDEEYEVHSCDSDD